VGVFGFSRLSNTPQPSPQSSPTPYPEDEYYSTSLEDIEVIATIGMGGFGRVELVTTFDLLLIRRQFLIC